ncbi:hypothetical protein AB0H71_33625 [Nocardia sp. NPDC050697]|uniref:hypothetical protein n=1 Tax=Nocardia sp. NPDC050697 TaxID=3155158 RepID=UPI0033C26102
MTTPDSPRNKWAPRTVRLDDETWKSARVKLATDGESWQGVMETLAHGWLSGAIDLEHVRAALSKDTAPE